MAGLLPLGSLNCLFQVSVNTFVQIITGMPLTPVSPEDRVQVVGSKGAVRSKENVEEPSSLVHYSPSLSLQ